ncbi:MAG: hypothetical protein IJY21_00945 [Clostridia bacterium]|nr:hypothetical protein [Clostridia bacterium]
MSALKNNSSMKKWQALSYRAIAAIVAIACVAAFFLPYTIFASTPFGLVTAEKKLYELFELVPDAPFKFLGFIPMFTNPKSVLGLAGGLVTYVIIIALAAAFVLAVISAILGKKAEFLLFLSTIVYTWGAALYMIAVVSISCYLPMKIIFDVSAIVLAAIGTLAYVAIIYVKLGKQLCLLNSVRFLLTLAFTVCLFLALAFDYDLVSKLIAESAFYKIALVAATALTVVNVIFASVRASKQRAFSFDFINSAVELAVSAALIFLSLSSPVTDVALLIFSSIAAAISLVLFVLTFVGVKAAKQKDKSDAARAANKEQPEAAPAPTTKPAPAQTAKTASAQTATPAPAQTAKSAPATAPVAPAMPAAATMEDFFAGKQIDKFIATLNVAERNQFASLYVLKLKDVMPEIPAYQIGGDNRYFFEMVFITLGEYRDDIPDGLLFKMYQHMCVEYPQLEIEV